MPSKPCEFQVINPSVSAPQKFRYFIRNYLVADIGRPGAQWKRGFILYLMKQDVFIVQAPEENVNTDTFMFECW